MAEDNASPESGGTEEGYRVRLARSDKTVFVPKGSTILFTLLEAGYNVAFSCASGMCGTCETDVLEGQPDHRDFVLSEEERAAGNVMMICCSGSCSPELVLDL
jgi:vanillate O-demethylase ferredoxin subunit